MHHAITPSASLLCRRGDPVQCCRQWLTSEEQGDALLVVEFALRQYWLTGEPALALTALYCRQGGEVEVAVTDQQLLTDGSSGPLQYRRWLAQTGAASVRVGEPLRFAPLAIGKPWGQEIWYSGVEARGVCGLAAGGGESPIPWLQAVLLDAAAGEPGQALVLLKILDPLAAEVTGDLYFELHREKQEVYVVTHVDRAAWPDGIGYIRYGFAPAALERYPDRALFRAAYLAAVQAYEVVRRELDRAATDPGQALLSREAELRQAMDGFTHMRPLQLGDVVKVPLLLPHSLQHGVRTIEFQTPVYERQILSFAQQVVTQGHWDTPAAVADMALLPPAGDDLELLAQDEHRRVERIVDFSDFEVQRITLAAGGAHFVQRLDRYAVVMTVSGELALGAGWLAPEEAALLPRHWCGKLLSTEPSQPLILLLALPRS